jgi:hypothetical protein
MTTISAFNYAIPYDIFTGYWTGIANTFTPKGEFVKSWPYKVAIYWQTPYTHLHFRQDPLSAELRNALRLPDVTERLVRQEMDLYIEGKYGKTAPGGTMMNIAAETTPDVYIFHVSVANASWYNCQHCVTPNERKVIGPQLDQAGNVTMVISQTFNRVSYEVPPQFRRALT